MGAGIPTFVLPLPGGAPHQLGGAGGSQDGVAGAGELLGQAAWPHFIQKVYETDLPYLSQVGTGATPIAVHIGPPFLSLKHVERI